MTDNGGKGFGDTNPTTQMQKVFLPSPLPRHLSHSQAGTLSDCSERYRLERYYHVPQRPGWALIGGKATHVGTELIDYLMLDRSLLASHLGLNENGEALDIASDEVRVLRSRGKAKTDQEILLELRENEGTFSLVTAIDLQWEVTEPVAPADAGSVNVKSSPVPLEVQALGVFLLEQEVEAARREHPEYPDEADWKAFGRVSAKYPHKEARDWWTDHIGLFIWRYMHWRRFSGFQIAMLDMATPAIETEVSSDIGNARVVGYLDRVCLDLEMRPVVLDIKSNANEPAEDEQLGQYAVQLQQLGFPKPGLGYYWMARTGKLGSPRDLSGYSLESFTYKYEIALRRRNAGEWIANTKSTICSFCGVKDYCYAQKGKFANLVPKPWETGTPIIRSEHKSQ